MFSMFGMKKSQDMWRLSLNFEKTRDKYIKDGSLSKTFSVPQLELRAILDSPIALKFLMTHSDEQLCVVLFQSWCGFNECLNSNLNRNNILMSWFDFWSENIAGNQIVCYNIGVHVMDEVVEECRALLARGGAADGAEECARKAASVCFDVMFSCIYIPFRDTAEFNQLQRLICSPDSWITPASFTYFDVIAEGGFGMVLWCAKKTTGQQFAMKIQSKNRLLRHFHRDKRRVMTELQGYSACDHPYVTKLSYATQTSSLALLVLPIASCGDLARSLTFTEGSRFSFERVQFYAAEIVSALLYLHNQGMIYRDLKPGNVLLNSDGHVMLADFGSLSDTGQVVGTKHSVERSMDRTPVPISIPESPNSPGGQPGLDVRSRSLVGTVEYMAPEIILIFGKRMIHKDGYSTAVDWWSLGILIYRLLVGAVPFLRASHDHLQVAMPELIATGRSFEEIFISFFGTVNFNVPELPPVAVDLLQHLLAFSPKHRLCGSGGSSEEETRVCPVRSHIFFQGIDWVALESKSILPPYLPAAEETTTLGPRLSGGIDFPEMMLRAGRLEMCETDDYFDVYLPKAGIMGNIMHSIHSMTNRHSVSEVQAKHMVSESDQKFFFGWNYVSCDLIEEPVRELWITSAINAVRRVITWGSNGKPRVVPANISI